MPVCSSRWATFQAENRSDRSVTYQGHGPEGSLVAIRVEHLEGDAWETCLTALGCGAVWCADITYLWTLSGWVYLAAIIDLATRKIVGWSMARHMRTELVECALVNALACRKPASMLVHHSDRGSQYASGSYQALLVIVRIWDDRRLVVPLGWFLENPFQNRTRTNSKLLGTVFLHVDYTVPLELLRVELKRLCEASEHWDERVCLLQVTESRPTTLEIRALVSAADSGKLWDLRCEVREGLVAYLAREHPGALPRSRAVVESGPGERWVPAAELESR